MSTPALPVPRHRIIIASTVGTTIEFFDFYIYATAAVSVFPLLFFPAGEGSAALLASCYFVAMWTLVPRPIDEWSTIVLLVIVRLLSVKRGWDAPNVDDLRLLRVSRSRGR